MDAKTPTMQHVYRQRSSVGLAAVCGVTGLILLGSLARNWAGYPRPLFVAWVIFGMAVAWSVFVRPAVLLDIDGVLIRNVLRDIHIPWNRLTGVSSRWNLSVSAGDKSYSAWALSAQPERPKRAPGGMFRLPTPGRLEGVSTADARSRSVVPKVTAQTVARSVRAAKEEYDDAVARGQLPATSEVPVRVTWMPLVIVVLLVPAITVVGLTLI